MYDKHDRPAGSGDAPSLALVLRAFRDRLSQQFNLLDRVLQRLKPDHVGPKVRNEEAVSHYAAISGNEADRGKADMGDAVVVPEGRCSIEEDYGRVCARNAGQLPFSARDCLGEDWRLGVGFVGHDDGSFLGNT